MKTSAKIAKVARYLVAKSDPRSRLLEEPLNGLLQTCTDPDEVDWLRDDIPGSFQYGAAATAEMVVNKLATKPGKVTYKKIEEDQNGTESEDYGETNRYWYVAEFPTLAVFRRKVRIPVGKAYLKNIWDNLDLVGRGILKKDFMAFMEDRRVKAYLEYLLEEQFRDLMEDYNPESYQTPYEKVIEDTVYDHAEVEQTCYTIGEDGEEIPHPECPDIEWQITPLDSSKTIVHKADVRGGMFECDYEYHVPLYFSGVKYPWD